MLEDIPPSLYFSLMLPFDRLKRILVLALPIIGGMISQNILNLVDTAMVGTLGNEALAAVGIGGFATFMSQALIIGVSSGVQATSARRKGEGRFDVMAAPLNAGLVVVLVSGIVISIFLYWLIPHVYHFLNSDIGVQNAGIPYLQVRVLAVVFVGMNFAFRGYWNAVDMTKLYMSTLVLMHIVNIALNYVLIFGKFGFPQLGTTGAAIGTAASTVVGTLVYFIFGLKYATENGFLHCLPSRENIMAMIRLSLPSGLQQFFFATGFTILFWIIGKVGTPELAAANVLINIILICILPGIGLGLSAATLVGQSLGSNEPHEAMRWGWDVVKVGIILIGFLGLPMFFFPNLILMIFIKEPSTLALATAPIQFSGVTIFIDAVGLILMNALLGAGDAKKVMWVSTSFQWMLFLPMAYLIGPVFGMGLMAIWVWQGIYRTLQAVTFAVIWKAGHWSKIQV